MTEEMVSPDQRQTDQILRALSETLPEEDRRRLGAFLAGASPLDISDGDARRIVDALKSAADRHWQIDPNRSVQLADAIIAIGDARRDTWTRALGLMAKGDAIKFVRSQQEAWMLLEEAARLFASVGDEVAWARTWIGRLHIAAQLNRLPEALEQAEQAREIFVRNGETLRRLRLDMTLGTVNWQTENHAAAEAHYDRALGTALALGDGGADEARAIYNNLGLIAQSRGEPHRALGYFEQAAGLARAQGLEAAEVICKLNMATSRKQLGEYRQALALLHEIRPRYAALHGAEARIQSDIADCLVALNQPEEAEALYGQAREAWLLEDSRFYAARAALLQAMAEAGLGDTAGARTLLDLAEAEFSSLGDTGLTALVDLRRGQLALRDREPAVALVRARAAARRFAAEGQAHLQAEAALLEANALLSLGDTAGAGDALAISLERARACASPSLMYSAHLSLGRLAEREGRLTRALRRYAAAEAILERQYRNLTLTLRPAFLSSALDAQRARVALFLRLGRIADAFETVERMRAQIALGYLSGRESLRWAAGDPASAVLASELERLRGVHHAMTARAVMAGEAPALPTSPGSPDAVRALERQMRSLTEQLHLRRPDDAPDLLHPPTVAELQARLGKQDGLIAYYDDGVCFHAFVMDRAAITHVCLETDSANIEHAMEQLQRNLGRALVVGARGAAALVAPAKVVLARLGRMLLGPLAAALAGRTRLYVVPYGPLHAMPFNLLCPGARYQIEETEIVTLPSASLLLRSPPHQKAGARVLIHDDDGRLPDVAREAEVIGALFPAEVWRGQEATRGALRAAPLQILHAGAHGAHRTDNPDFSHIALADGQLMTSDLLQMDLSYELVTLSACETGRGRVTAGDETLGIGWAFLYAGAGAVVSSLWRVSDERTAPLMEAMYSALRGGLTKSAALRQAQIAALAADSGAHPAYWGAFQLYGSPDALSRIGFAGDSAPEVGY